MRGLKYYLPGILLIMTGALILAVPEILVAFVAATMAVLGFGTLAVGHRMRKAEKEWHRPGNWAYHEHGFGPTFFSRQYFWF